MEHISIFGEKARQRKEKEEDLWCTYKVKKAILAKNPTNVHGAPILYKTWC